MLIVVSQRVLAELPDGSQISFEGIERRIEGSV